MRITKTSVQFTHEEFKQSIEKRFKILALLAIQLGVWEEKMEKLGNEIDNGHPQSLVALEFYEEKIIEVMEMEEPTNV